MTDIILYDITYKQPGQKDSRSEEHTSELQSLSRISYAGSITVRSYPRFNAQAPGVPGGAIMAALGLLQSMLGFDETAQGLIHWVQNFLTENFDTTEANYQYLIYPVVGIFLAGLFVRYIFV